MRSLHVGVGNAGYGKLAAMARHPAWQIAGCVDVSPAALKMAQEKFGVPASACFQDFGEAMRKVEADAAVISTPPQFHREMVSACLRKGMHVLMEKPLADRWEDCVAIVKAGREAKSRGQRVMVFQNYRYMPQAQAAKRFIDDGRLGEIAYVSVNYRMAAYHLRSYRRTLHDCLLIEMSIHHFDLMRFFLGSTPVSVYALAWNPPWSWSEGDASAAAIFQFANGARAAYLGDWASREQETGYYGHWRLDGERGSLLMLDNEVYFSQVPEQLTGPPRGLDEAEPIIKAAREQLKKPSERVRINPLPEGELRNPFEDFTAAIREGREPAVDIEDNIKSSAMSFGSILSKERGEKVNLSTMLEGIR